MAQEQNASGSTWSSVDHFLESQRIIYIPYASNDQRIFGLGLTTIDSLVIKISHGLALVFDNVNISVNIITTTRDLQQERPPLIFLT